MELFSAYCFVCSQLVSNIHATTVEKTSSLNESRSGQCSKNRVFVSLRLRCMLTNMDRAERVKHQGHKRCLHGRNKAVGLASCCAGGRHDQPELYRPTASETAGVVSWVAAQHPERGMTHACNRRSVLPECPGLLALYHAAWCRSVCGSGERAMGNGC
ncbi:hypothetical protein LX32DRAFT_147657 [Colletotrichum zoysiae]|uniref:Uncharacterized protein n=1 Tax=Colletotrichum zoysiae TaxID=1216348 RepID=A0AAD9H884_9PEZI|nr:hypothetical protein LX32DRAFT_147657 [Colletotrichum zoysiae]